MKLLSINIPMRADLRYCTAILLRMAELSNGVRFVRKCFNLPVKRVFLNAKRMLSKQFFPEKSSKVIVLSSATKVLPVVPV